MSTRFLFGIESLFVYLLLLISLYLQFIENMLPCPLCTLQRLCFFILSILFSLGLLFANKKRLILFFNIFILVVTIVGMLLAGRHMWLQYFPNPTDQCSADIRYLLNTLPFNEVLEKIFNGSTECSQRGFEFLYLDLAEWSFIWFCIFFCMTMYLLFRRAKY